MAAEETQTSMDLYKDLETPDIHDAPQQIEGAREAYKAYAMLEDPPTKLELVGWYLYALCSYFVQTVLLPILFPLIITQIASPSSYPAASLEGHVSYTSRGVICATKEMDLYQRLVNHSITVNGSKFSPLHWTSISWATGIFLSGPILAFFAPQLDYGGNQPLILGGATTIGAFSCLLTGFFKTTWLFPPYIVAIVAATTLGSAVHTRHMGLMVRGLTAHLVGKHHFPRRRAVASWLSSYATAAGCLGSAIIAAFTYHMLRRSDQLTSLWVVSIFSGLKWFVGISHAGLVNRPGVSSTSPPEFSTWAHIFSIIKYPHAVGSLVGVFLSSFSSSCIFTSGTLYVVGNLCIRPVFLLTLWIAYFSFPLASLPALYPIQQIIRTDALRMNLLGFFLSAVTSGVGFYFKDWHQTHILIVCLVQSTAAAILHAFGRVLLMNCSPAGREGVFAGWFAWVKVGGACAGFAVASGFPGDVRTTFGVAFCGVIVGVFVLVFGNVSDFGGAVAAGHVKEEVGEEGSPVNGLDRIGEGRESVGLSLKLAEEKGMEE